MNGKESCDLFYTTGSVDAYLACKEYEHQHDNNIETDNENSNEIYIIDVFDINQKRIS